MAIFKCVITCFFLGSTEILHTPRILRPGQPPLFSSLTMPLVSHDLVDYLWVVMDEGAEIGRLMERIELCGLKGPSWNQSCGFMLLKLCFSFLCCCHILWSCFISQQSSSCFWDLFFYEAVLFYNLLLNTLTFVSYLIIVKWSRSFTGWDEHILRIVYFK